MNTRKQAAFHVRRNYEPQTWDEGIDCSVDPDTGEVLESRTHQDMKDDCDINKILERYLRTGELPDMISRDPQYGDFAAVPDFMAAQNIVAKGNEQFAALDAHIRKRFGNDPAEFLAFATDPANQDEMIKMGLAKRRETPQDAPGGAKKDAPEGAKGKPAKAPKEPEPAGDSTAT